MVVRGPVLWQYSVYSLLGAVELTFVINCPQSCPEPFHKPRFFSFLKPIANVKSENFRLLGFLIFQVKIFTFSKALTLYEFIGVAVVL